MQNIPLSDDPTVPDEAELWRRIPPVLIITDSNHPGGPVRRPSTGAFDNSSNEEAMSVFLAAVVLETGRKPEDILAGLTNFGLVGFTAGLVRAHNQFVVRDPQPGEPAHAAVIGHKSKTLKKILAHTSRWVVLPDDPAAVV
jgi:hypothetical protein